MKKSYSNSSGSSDNAFSDCSHIIALNNEGATSLASGDMALAISSFCQALHTSKSCLGRRDEQRRQQKEQQEQERDGDCYYHHHNHEERNYPHAGSHYEQDYQSQSQSVPHFDIGHLMEAGCFGLNTNEENAEHNASIDSSSSNKIKVSLSDSISSASAYSNIQKDNKEEDEDSKGSASASSSNSDNFVSGDFIYRKPIHIPESYAHHVGLQRSEVILPSIVIFNLALAHHLWAMKKDNSPEQQVAATNLGHGQHSSSLLLKKSAKLYGLAIQLQEGQMVSGGPRSYSKLFFLSCINNLGNTHRLLGDISSSEKIYQQLLTMLMYLNYSEQQQGYELSTTTHTTTTSATTNTSSSDSLSTSPGRISSATTQSVSTSTYSAGSTYGSFFRNIFQTEVNAAPAAWV